MEGTFNAHELDQTHIYPVTLRLGKHNFLLNASHFSTCAKVIPKGEGFIPKSISLFQNVPLDAAQLMVKLLKDEPITWEQVTAGHKVILQLLCETLGFPITFQATRDEQTLQECQFILCKTESKTQ